MAVLHPRKSVDPALLHDTDLGGPFIFALLLGLSLIFVSVFSNTKKIIKHKP